MILKRHVNTWDSDRTADPDLIAYPTSTTLSSEAPGKFIVKRTPAGTLPTGHNYQYLVCLSRTSTCDGTPLIDGKDPD